MLLCVFGMICDSRIVRSLLEHRPPTVRTLEDAAQNVSEVHGGHQIIPASDPNGRFITSEAVRLLGLLKLLVHKDFFSCPSVRTSSAFRLVGTS